MHKIREIVLRDVKTDNDSSSLIAKIDDKGDLVLEGYDIGESPKEFWGIVYTIFCKIEIA